jgi:hypothetical protein
MVGRGFAAFSRSRMHVSYQKHLRCLPAGRGNIPHWNWNWNWNWKHDRDGVCTYTFTSRTILRFAYACSADRVLFGFSDPESPAITLLFLPRDTSRVLHLSRADSHYQAQRLGMDGEHFRMLFHRHLLGGLDHPFGGLQSENSTQPPDRHALCRYPEKACSIPGGP